MATTTSYLGMNFLDADLDGIRSAFVDALGRERYGYVVTPNVDHVVSYHRGNNPLREVYDGARFQLCDSRILAKLARLSGIHLKPTPGSDLTRDLLERPLWQDLRIAVIGPESQAIETLRRRFPKADIRYISSPSRLERGTSEWNETVAGTGETEWDVLLVCLSFPKQEFFARDLALVGRKSGLALCVGASIDFLTGRQTRAPLWMQRAGLEWLYRLAADPQRMAGRYLVRGPAVFALAARYGRASGGARGPARRSGFDPTSNSVLYLTTVLPDLRETGGEIATMNFIGALRSAGKDVEVVAYRRKGRSRRIPTGFESPRDLLIESANSPLQTAIWLAAAFCRGRPFSVQKYVTHAMRRLVQKKIGDRTFAFAVIDHAQAGWLLPVLPKDLPVVFVAHNVECRLYGKFGEGQRPKGAHDLKSWIKSQIYLREGAELHRVESALAEQVREIWTLSAEDAEAFHTLMPSGRVRTFDLPGQNFSALALPPSARSVGLIGSWIWDVNRAGLDWFLSEVAPHLPCDIEIVVAGRSHYPAGTSIGRVRFVGFVPDAGEFIRTCGVVVIPSVAGSGVQIKTIETLGTGVPTVATSVALRGISDTPPNVWIANEPHEMIEAIRNALARPRSDGASATNWRGERQRKFDRDVQAALMALEARRSSEPLARNVGGSACEETREMEQGFV